MKNSITIDVGQKKFKDGKVAFKWDFTLSEEGDYDTGTIKYHEIFYDIDKTTAAIGEEENEKWIVINKRDCKDIPTLDFFKYFQNFLLEYKKKEADLLDELKKYLNSVNEIFPNYINSLIGGVFGYGIIWTIIFLYKVLRNKEGMGLGDAKLLAAIGFWFGWISIPFVIFISSIVALIAVVPSLINKSKKFSSEIPFGPFIIIGCILYIIFIEQYKNLLFG